ncbi:NmrA/HSCARG family protein [Halobium salinum]|uniref:NmrA/HSCARG family protein n=1 Tax=Halobium salinum TaxID=1364940 RepID=A0ABD5PCW8_9EURY|nr:NmrA/HSCARG family protein [Halobium salinum]
MASKRILVAGATGKQGGAVVSHLRSGAYGEFDVFGLTRDATSDAARELESAGVHVVEGDLTDRATLDAALEGMDGAFLVTTFFESGVDVETEQGETFVDACADAGVEHLVYASVGEADGDTGLAHFESKHAVERHIRERGVPATVLRPVFFMQNFEGLLGDGLDEGRLAMPMAEGVELEMVDVDDIGAVAAIAFANPDEYVGETIQLAGDSLTLAEMAEAFETVLGRDVEPEYVPIEDARAAMGDEMADMFDWFDRVGYDTDRDALAVRTGHAFADFETYLAEHWGERRRPASA